jgi:hypothetical protein
MVNTVTGERVVYRGALGGHMRVTWSENWLRYDYVHSELTFPLVARATVRDKGTRDQARIECLSVDYPRSARLWRDDPFGSRPVSTAPAYGVWRRVDDCIVDAFTCWPRGATGGWNGDAVELVGGWLNGSWRPDFARVSIGGSEMERELRDAEGGPSGNPALMNLWAKPAPLWRMAGEAAPGTAPATIDGREALLTTADGRLVLLPPHDDTAEAPGVFTLSDNERGRRTRFSAVAAPRANLWHVRLPIEATSAQAEPSPAALDYDRRLELGWSVIDAFGAWRGAVTPAPANLRPAAAHPPDAIDLYGGYRGGMRVAAVRCEVLYM